MKEFGIRVNLSSRSRKCSIGSCFIMFNGVEGSNDDALRDDNVQAEEMVYALNDDENEEVEKICKNLLKKMRI